MQRVRRWGSENKYGIIYSSWVLSIITSFVLVGRNSHFTTKQKVAQARVYAQGFTIAVLFITAMIEVGDSKSGRVKRRNTKELAGSSQRQSGKTKAHFERYAGEDQWRG